MNLAFDAHTGQPPWIPASSTSQPTISTGLTSRPSDGSFFMLNLIFQVLCLVCLCLHCSPCLSLCYIFYIRIFLNTKALSLLPASEVALDYKQLWTVERAFREMKCTLKLRPMYHWTESQIRGHIMVCFLAFYLEMVLRQMLSSVTPEADYTRVITVLTKEY